MEALNSASLGAMGSLLRKLHELLHNEDWAPKIGQLVEDVGSISSKMVKLSDVHDPPLTVNCWMIDARELSCDMENCLDQADTLSKIDWIDEILGFKTRTEEVIERFERFKLDYILSHPTVPNTVVNNRLGTVYREQKPTVPIGMEGPTNKVLGLLEPKGDDENELRLKVVSILGVAGIGKSMVVHELWWKLREGIQCCAFVQAAKKPDMRMILRSILIQIRPHHPLEVFQVPNLIHDIRKHLQDKRYFIIIDDIWAISFWDVVSRAFPDGYCCSRIITTTAVEDVALACCSYDPENIFKMKPLSDNHSKDLFISIVLGSGKGCPQQFYDVSHEITRKCGGLPLAITCIATLVASLPGTLQQWEYVRNFLYHNLRTNSTSEEVLKQVLELCFSSLPEFLKTCLLYLSVYPENYIIMKEDLAKQWTAEGFICTTDGRDNIEVAQSYFDELVSLGLIQRIDINSKKKGRLSYTVHPVVFDFITCKSIEHNFITIIDYSQSVIQLSNKIRRLSLHFGSATYATTPASVGLSQVRSLAFMGLLNCMPSLEEFKLVRVVILHFRGDDGSLSFPLTRIRGLLLLRYLQVKCNITVELPDQIKCLKHLETLDINARVASFTSGLLHVPSLLDVRFGGKTSPTLSPVASGAVISLDDSSNSSSFIPIFLRRLELVPPTCIFSRLPEWIRQLRKLCTLQIEVRELSRNDISVLAELPALSALSLYVWTPIARDIFFSKMEFPALEYFKFVGSALLLGLEEEAMPNLWRLKIGFNAERGWNCSYMLPGIQNLLNLEEVVAKIGAEPGAEESDWRAAESAFMDTVRMHPCHPKLKMKRVDRVGEAYDSSEKRNWGQQKEASERDKVQYETKKGEPFVERDKIPGEMPNDNTKKLVPRCPPAEPSAGQQIVPTAPPQSSKSFRFPLRPGKGSIGTRCLVKANHFFAELPDKDLHHYDVSITPEVTSRVVSRAIIKELVNLYKQSYLGGRLPTYDGRKSLYTAGPLPFTSQEFHITLFDDDGGPGSERRRRNFKVVIKFAARADLHRLELFLAGRHAEAPQEALQVLDIVLRELPSSRPRYAPFGRSFFSPDLGRRQSLGDGLESWHGFYQSIRPTQMGLSLNIDMSATAFIEPLPVIKFVAQLLNCEIHSRPLSDVERVKINKALRGVKVEVTHRGNMRRKYRISGLTTQATRELTFPVDEGGTIKSVVQYFQETYGFAIQHTYLPCLQVGNQQRPNYLPMEVCKIVEGQRYSKRLNQNQIRALLVKTSQRPRDRERDIIRMVKQNAYDKDDYAQEFGIKISDRLASVEARILPAPRLKYNETGREKDCLPRVGRWNMMNKKMVDGGKVRSWICVNFSRNVQDSVVRGFCHELALMCQASGMDFAREPVLPPLYARPDQVERALKARYHDAMNVLGPKHKELDLLIGILPDNNGSLYGDLKRVCEIDLGIVSQCCCTKQVFKMNKQVLANLALKINVKVGGRNTVLVDALSRRIPLVTDRPTIIFGADVTHPHPGEDSSPSIAAVVASQDWPEVTKYAGLVSAQAPRQELIEDLYKVWQDPQRGTVSGGMIRELLVSFKKSTGQKPQRIIFYRDGVSEGQFYQVLLYELNAIRKACASLEENYQPKVTFVVVQKRHHTRLFAHDHNDRNSIDWSGNILPGTVVDSKICHPTEFDFYLCSHAGIQGTSRPAHYHVLWDENNFSADELQTLTNNLCYTYARCTRSVSIVPPAYYAHLAAFRARFYMEPETSDSGSVASGPAGRGPQSASHSTRAPGGAAVRPLPALKDNVKRVMFYC